MPPRRPKTPDQRVACYCRVSTEDQGERQTIKSQLDFLRKYVDLHQLDCHDFYVDDGVSGTVPLDERPEGRRLLADAQAGRFGVVLVFRLDRLGRSLRALLAAHDRLDGAGIAIRSATEPFDTSTPIGQFLFQLLGSLAELEKATITERMTLGRDRVAREGRNTGGKIPQGYDTDAEGRFVLSERTVPTGQTEADVIRGVFENVAGGATLLAEARRLQALGVPCVTRRSKRPDEVSHRWWPATVYKIIKNPIYKGARTIDGRNGSVPVPVPALVTPELWERAQVAMTRNRDLSSRPGAADYLLRGLVRCRTIVDDGTPEGAACGRAYIGSPGGPKRPDGTHKLYYHCNGARSHSQAPDRPRCHARSIPADLLEEAVWADVRAFVRDPGAHLAGARDALAARSRDTADRAGEAARLRSALAAKAAERERAQLLFRRGLADLDETEAAIRALDDEAAQLGAMLSSLDAERAELAATAGHLDRTAAVVAALAELVDAGDAGDHAARRRVFDLLIRDVTLATTTEESRRGKRVSVRKRVEMRIRYLFGPTTDGGHALGSIASALPEAKLPHMATIDRALTVAFPKRRPAGRPFGPGQNNHGHRRPVAAD
jgi:site-specific DNA recombinase